MKNIFLIALSFVLLNTTAFGQPFEKKAKAILDEVSAKIKTYKTIKIEFTYRIQGAEKNNKTATNAENKSGTALIKGEKYNLSISGQTIICDGKTTWTYIKDSKEVQIKTVDVNSNEENPQKILTGYNANYKPKWIKEEAQEGKQVDVIDLVPIKGKSFYRIRMTVDKVKKQVISSTVYQKDGSEIMYKIKSFVSDIPLNDASFSFNKTDYPGVEVIDMR